jgi:hypothetical protein
VVQAYDALLEELDSRFARQSTLAHCARSLLATAAGQQSPLPEVLAQVLRTTGADRIYLAENLQTTATTWQAQARVVAGAPGRTQHRPWCRFAGAAALRNAPGCWAP